MSRPVNRHLGVIQPGVRDTPAPTAPKVAPAPAAPKVAPAPAGFATGSGVVDTTAIAIGVAGLSITIRANGSNTGVICIGNTAESAAEGYILSSGDVSPPIYVDETYKVFIVGSVKGQGYSWLAF